MRRLARLVGVAAIASLIALDAAASEASLRIVSAGRDVDPLLLAIEMTLADGFKTYWRSTGQFGQPPAFDWAGSENIAALVVRFPVPRRLDADGFEIVGYAERVAFPMEIRRIDPARPAHLQLTATYSVCHDFCIEEQARFDLVVPGGPAPSEDEDSRVAAARERLPRGGGFAVDEMGVVGSRLTLGIGAVLPLSAPDLFVEQSGRLIEGTTTWSLAPDRRHAAVALESGSTLRWNGTALTITLVDRGAANEVIVPFPQPPS